MINLKVPTDRSNSEAKHSTSRIMFLTNKRILYFNKFI